LGFSTYGFYSIACADKPGTKQIDPEMVMVRARVRKHLTNLRQRFPSLADAKILTLPNRDYGYRLIVAKAVWAEALKELAKEQTWSNFKNEAARNQGKTGPDYVRALHDVWEIMYGLQEHEKRTDRLNRIPE
jgi:hypothetical protein